MVTKVVTANDVDNVTIVINGENKLQAKLPETTASEVVIEEVPNVATANAVVKVDGVERKITKLGKVNGTDWLVFQLDTSTQTEPLPILTDLSVECGEIVAAGDHFEVNRPPVVRITPSNMQGRIPQGVKFVVAVGNETRSYSYPYSASNEYVWNNIADFSYDPGESLTFSNAVVVFTDGQSYPTPPVVCSFSPMSLSD